MPTEASLFRRIDDAADEGTASVLIEFNGAPLRVPAHCSVAAALLAAGVSRFRATPVSGAPRAPYCMMGVCFDCLMEIDGQPSRQGCLVTVAEGMQVRTQEGARDLGLLSVERADRANNSGKSDKVDKADKADSPGKADKRDKRAEGDNADNAGEIEHA